MGARYRRHRRAGGRLAAHRPCTATGAHSCRGLQPWRPTALERLERLEQLRGARARHPNQGACPPASRPIGVDTPAGPGTSRSADARGSAAASDSTRAGGPDSRARTLTRWRTRTAAETGQIHLRDRRRRLVARQGTRRGVDRLRCSRATATGSRCRSSTPTSTSIPGTMSPYPARRGLRHRRRRRDGPRPRPLRAVHQHGGRRATTTGRPARSTCR